MEEQEVSPLRLHPMTLLQKVILSLPGFAALLIATWTSPDEGNLTTLIVTVLYAVVALPIIYLRFSRFRYWITDTELVITQGVFTRQHRNIPLDKIQNVEIVQRLIPRLTGTAQVQVVTAGSSSAEGVLQFVSLEEAHRIRELVRSYSRRSVSAPDALHVGRAAIASEMPDAEHHPEDQARAPLYRMTPTRVLLSGVFRFSLLYIALIFSALQFFQPDPDQIAAWVLKNSYDPIVESVRASPISSALLAVLGAAALSWVSGIAVNFNKYFGFRLWREGSKIGKRSGLLTISEGSIPLKKIQAMIFHTNPVRAAAGWNSLHVQTMGLDTGDAGHRVVVPFARESESNAVSHEVVSWSEPASFTPVSRKRILRLFLRYSIVLFLVIAGLRLWDSRAIWLIGASPLIFGIAYLQWRFHSFAFTGDALAVRRGVINRQTWILPVSKMQVFYSTQSFFQRRRGLKSVYVDSAGASAMSRPVVIDLESTDADALIGEVYKRFRLED